MRKLLYKAFINLGIFAYCVTVFLLLFSIVVDFLVPDDVFTSNPYMQNLIQALPRIVLKLVALVFITGIFMQIRRRQMRHRA